MFKISTYGDLSGAAPKASTAARQHRLYESATQLLRLAVPADLSDDRFGPGWHDQVKFNHSYAAALASDVAGNPVAMLESWNDGAKILRLEPLLHKRFSEPANIAEGSSLIESLANELETATLIDGLAGSAELSDKGIARQIRMWARPTSAPIETYVAHRAGIVDRHLFQMRRDLSSLELPDRDDSVAFHPGSLDELINVNNRSFATHPDQGNMTRASFKRAATEGWFNPEGIRLWHVAGELAAFCWTKLHKEPPLGEIYVVGVDPTFQGQGLGRLVTASGLRWLQQDEQKLAMLYVEATNNRAVSVYEKLGFVTVREDKAWVLPSLAN